LTVEEPNPPSHEGGRESRGFAGNPGASLWISLRVKLRWAGMSIIHHNSNAANFGSNSGFRLDHRKTELVSTVVGLVKSATPDDGSCQWLLALWARKPRHRPL